MDPQEVTTSKRKVRKFGAKLHGDDWLESPPSGLGDSHTRRENDVLRLIMNHIEIILAQVVILVPPLIS
jgi:hypothetical protein